MNRRDFINGPLLGGASSQGLAADAVAVTGSTENTGGGQSVSLMQPFLGVFFLIALVGVFPSPN